MESKHEALVRVGYRVVGFDNYMQRVCKSYEGAFECRRRRQRAAVPPEKTFKCHQSLFWPRLAPRLLFVLAAGVLTVQTNVSSVKIILLGSTPAVAANLEESTGLLMGLYTEYMEKSAKTWLGTSERLNRSPKHC